MVGCKNQEWAGARKGARGWTRGARGARENLLTQQLYPCRSQSTRHIFGLRASPIDPNFKDDSPKVPYPAIPNCTVSIKRANRPEISLRESRSSFRVTVQYLGCIGNTQCL